MKVFNTAAAANLQTLYKNEMGADVEFVLKSKLENGEKRISAHKVILAAGSPVFQQMFYGDLKEGAVVEIPDESFEAFSEFLQFFYMAEIDLTEGNIYEVFKMVDKYDVQRCQADCENFIIDTVSSELACLYYDVALTFNYSNKLLKEVKDKICADAANVLKSSSFLKSSHAALKSILNMDHLNCSEFDVFTAAISWATENCKTKELEPSGENLKAELGDCFNLIRFPLMKAKELVDCSKRYEHLFEMNDFCAILEYILNHKPELSTHTPDLRFITKQRTWKSDELNYRKSNSVFIFSTESSEILLVGYEILISEAKMTPCRIELNGQVIEDNVDINLSAVRKTRPFTDFVLYRVMLKAPVFCEIRDTNSSFKVSLSIHLKNCEIKDNTPGLQYDLCLNEIFVPTLVFRYPDDCK